MPKSNNVPYSTKSILKTAQYSEKINEASQATGLGREVIFGALVEENHDYNNEILTKIADEIVNLKILGGLDHTALRALYTQTALAGKFDDATKIDKAFNVILNDVGPFNIQIGTSCRVIPINPAIN